MKNIFLISIQNFTCYTVHPLPLVLSLCSKEKSKLIKNSGTLMPEGFLFISGILSLFHHEHHPISMQWVTGNKLHCLPIDFPGYSFAWGYPGIIFSSLALKFSSSCLMIYWHSAIVRKLWLSSKSKRRYYKIVQHRKTTLAANNYPKWPESAGSDNYCQQTSISKTTTF